MTPNYSKAVSWINDVRIPFVDEKVNINTYNDGTFDPKNNLIGISQKGKKFNVQTNTQGRFPANLLVSDDMLNDGTTTKSGKGKSNTYDKNWIHYGGKYKQQRNPDFGDKGTNSRYYDIDKWFDKLLEDVE
jgi:hypothetical protein